MDSSSGSRDGVNLGGLQEESIVDPFLVEALQNPRHRLTSQYLLSVFLEFSKISYTNPDIV